MLLTEDFSTVFKRVFRWPQLIIGSGFYYFLKNIICTDAEYDIDPILTNCQVLFTLHGTTSYIVVQIR